jgi:hypothetical protein
LPRTRMPVLVMVLAVTVGCTSRPAAEVPDVPTAGAQVRALSVPLDAYKMSRLDLWTIEYSEDLITRDCMRSRGLDWELLPPTPVVDPDPLNRRRYGVMEPEVAARYGYHLPPLPPESATREAVWARRDKLPTKEHQAAYGDNGCRNEARKVLRAGIAGFDDSRLADFSSRAFQTSFDHPQVRAAFAEWSKCMATGGFHYPDPFIVLQDAAWKESARPDEREIATAKADVECKQKVNLSASWSHAELDIQSSLIQTNADEFRRFREAKDKELETARRVLAEH